MEKGIAFFDFDGTITDRDSFIEFIRFAKSPGAFIVGFVLLFPILVLYKLKLIKNWRAKEMVLSYFFSGMTAADFNLLCHDFSENQLPKFIRPKALAEIEMHQQAGRPVYIVSASPQNWLQAWCKQHGVGLIASKLALVEDKITGKLLGLNCYGKEKEERIKAEIDLSLYKQIWAYGDSSGDKAMLAMANKAFYRPFR